MNKFCLVFFLVCWGALALGCSSNLSNGGSATPSSSASVSSELTQEEAIGKATGAFKVFGSRLKNELEKAMAEGGPVEAVEVCHTIAPKLAQDSSQEFGFPLGRSSHRLRNPNNAASPYLVAYLEKYQDQGKKAPVQAVREGDSWIVVAPILTAPLCLNCHGDAKSFSPELAAALAAKYPDDVATGFQPGDLRGVFWARVPGSSVGRD